MNEKRQHLVAVIYPQAGGYVARIMPPGIVCFSENLEGLEEEIQKALADYSTDMDDMAEAAADFTLSAEHADWEDAVDEATVFYWDLDEKFKQ